MLDLADLPPHHPYAQNAMSLGLNRQGAQSSASYGNGPPKSPYRREEGLSRVQERVVGAFSLVPACYGGRSIDVTTVNPRQLPGPSRKAVCRIALRSRCGGS